VNTFKELSQLVHSKGGKAPNNQAHLLIINKDLLLSNCKK